VSDAERYEPNLSVIHSLEADQHQLDLIQAIWYPPARPVVAAVVRSRLTSATGTTS
jgi:hypothetical protein